MLFKNKTTILSKCKRFISSFKPVILVALVLSTSAVKSQENLNKPVSPASVGMWLKGDLHVHSRHSTESSNNSISKIINFSKSVKMDYVCITDHDNHVHGDVEHHTWADPEFKSIHCFYYTAPNGQQPEGTAMFFRINLIITKNYSMFAINGM